MKKIFTTLFIILFTVSMFAQEAEPFTLEYTFKANATAEELYDRATHFFKSEPEIAEYPTSLALYTTIWNGINTKRTIKSYKGKEYIFEIHIATKITCLDNKYVVRIKRISTTVIKDGIYYLISKTIPYEFSEDARTNTLLKDSKDFAIDFIENSYLPLLQEYMDNPPIKNWYFQEE